MSCWNFFFYKFIEYEYIIDEHEYSCFIENFSKL